MKRQKNLRITQDDYIKANRKASREAEIADYGHPLCHKRVHKSKKVYDRKRIKKADCSSDLPFSFLRQAINPIRAFVPYRPL